MISVGPATIFASAGLSEVASAMRAESALDDFRRARTPSIDPAAAV
jgi:hypothetical protein